MGGRERETRRKEVHDQTDTEREDWKLKTDTKTGKEREREWQELKERQKKRGSWSETDTEREELNRLMQRRTKREREWRIERDKRDRATQHPDTKTGKQRVIDWGTDPRPASTLPESVLLGSGIELTMNIDEERRLQSWALGRRRWRLWLCCGAAS